MPYGTTVLSIRRINKNMMGLIDDSNSLTYGVQINHAFQSRTIQTFFDEDALNTNNNIYSIFMVVSTYLSAVTK